MSVRKSYSPDFKTKIVLEILREEKTLAQLSSEYGVHTSQLKQWKKIALEGLPTLFTDEQKAIEKMKKEYTKQSEELYAEIGRLTTQLAWLKKNVVSQLSREERLALVEWESPELPITTQADLLGLNRSSLYYKPVAPSPEEIALKHRIDEIYTAHPYYGSRRITAQLKREGFLVNRKAVQRHMREMGIAAISPGPNLSKRRYEHLVYPYLLRGVVIQQPNQVWGIDITYIRMLKGWLYLTAVLDWYSRYVVSWELSDTLEIDFVCAAVSQAFSLARPQIMNSDQGSQFTSPQYIQLLKKAGVKISMDGRGRAQDNIFTERLWRTIKYMCTCTNTRVPGKQEEDWVNTLPFTITNAYTRHLPTGLRQRFTMHSLPGFPHCTSWRESPVKGCLKAIAWRRRLAPPLTGAPPGKGQIAKPGKQKPFQNGILYQG